MRRAEWEHVIAAAADVSGEVEIVVVGSQAILGSVPDPPESLLRSMEVDLYPRAAPDKADLIDGALGDGSRFQQSYGYYAHGVGPQTAKPPAGWEQRLVEVRLDARVPSAPRAVALCLEPHDLILAKCLANRDRDWEFARDALAAGIVRLEVLLDRVALLPTDPSRQEAIRTRLVGLRQPG
ncbi:MAG: hypothetical protein M3389_07115 [Actinomycetota bacterium]|nr:hypothetical protein [Actinomycetota bacterium]